MFFQRVKNGTRHWQRQIHIAYIMDQIYTLMYSSLRWLRGARTYTQQALLSSAIHLSSIGAPRRSSDGIPALPSLFFLSDTPTRPLSLSPPFSLVLARPIELKLFRPPNFIPTRYTLWAFVTCIISSFLFICPSEEFEK